MRGIFAQINGGDRPQGDGDEEGDPCCDEGPGDEGEDPVVGIKEKRSPVPIREKVDERNVLEETNRFKNQEPDDPPRNDDGGKGREKKGRCDEPLTKPPKVG